jgi:decaprenylphospho-beta-D-ribofuranose 2-oxidase
MNQFNEIEIDCNGLATCGSGVTIGELERAALAQGFFPKVVPGTEFVSLGGAFASDVHGKSHHVNGSFSNAVSEIKLRLANGDLVTLGQDSEDFWATAGGMGLTGAIEGIQIQLGKVETGFVVAQHQRVGNLDEMFESMREVDLGFPFTAAWVDFSGDFRGRGIVSTGRHANFDEISSNKRGSPFESHNPVRLQTPDIFPKGSINSRTVRVFNEFWFRKPLVDGVMNLQKFLHPLDGIGAWNRIYGKCGFLQYQFVVPMNQFEFIELVMQEMRKMKVGSFLGVLKCFGEQSRSHLGFPMPGWTLAVDIPVGIEGLSETLDRLDNKLIEAGGRIYLTKDSRMSASHIELMYPRINEWRKIRKRMDPEFQWQSDQSRRLRLCEMD